MIGDYHDLPPPRVEQPANALCDEAELPIDEVMRQMAVQPALAGLLCQALAMQIRQMTLASRNLLHNAIQHSPLGAPLQVKLATEGSHPVLRVSDWGQGVSPAVQARLAEPFVSGTPNGGSGLGLAICRSICDALHAQLHLRNRYNNSSIEGFDAAVEFAPLAHASLYPLHVHL